MLDAKDKRVLSDLKMIVEALDLPMLVVGAGARLLVFDRRFNLVGRGTKDWDVAVRITDWESFQVLRDRMAQGDPPKFSAARIPHRFVHISTGTEVDIVPFGEIAGQSGQIRWADGNQMNVMGLEEALIHASTERLDDLELQVVDTPAFVVLKLFAWSDRQGATSKDLDDIAFVFEHYTDDDRVFEDLTAELASGEIEYLNAAIYLLGRTIREKFRDETRTELNAILEQLIQSSSRRSDILKQQFEVLQRGMMSK
jgi:predicted nucleotidyltransferase